MKRLELVEGWRNAHKWMSTNCMALAAALQGAWIYVPPDLKANLPAHMLNAVTIVLLALGVVGRMFKQVTPDAPDDCEKS
jgi:hypothetical protein